MKLYYKLIIPLLLASSANAQPYLLGWPTYPPTGEVPTSCLFVIDNSPTYPCTFQTPISAPYDVQLIHNLKPHLPANGTYVVAMAAVGVNGPAAYSIPFTLTWVGTNVPAAKMLFDKRTNIFTSQAYSLLEAQPYSITYSIDGAAPLSCNQTFDGVNVGKYFRCPVTGSARSHTIVFTTKTIDNCNNDTTVHKGTCNYAGTLVSNPIIFNIVPVCTP